VKKIGIIGLGNMGQAIVRALVASGFPSEAILSFEVKQEAVRFVQDTYGVQVASSLSELTRQSNYILLAVKPQNGKAVLQAIASEMNESKILISIMAGITTSNLTAMLERPVKVVRVMPNICVAVAQGALGVSPNHLLSKEELALILELLQPLGSVVEVTEDQMDAVTALSGSGPAFVLAFLEALIDGGVKMGLARDKSYNLAVKTLQGTISMLDKEGVHPTLMKERVTSPGGTTIAGLATLDERGFKGIVIRCLEAAQARAKELSK
jgi:pyrroline-5-carboxylate reductase